MVLRLSAVLVSDRDCVVAVVTEGEAKTKLCQESYVAAWPNVKRCIASTCMAWRWSRAKETKAYLDAVQARMAATKENFNVATNKVWAEIGSTFEQTEGYCGLAGKPE